MSRRCSRMLRHHGRKLLSRKCDILFFYRLPHFLFSSCLFVSVCIVVCRFYQNNIASIGLPRASHASVWLNVTDDIFGKYSTYRPRDGGLGTQLTWVVACRRHTPSPPLFESHEGTRNYGCRGAACVDRAGEGNVCKHYVVYTQFTRTMAFFPLSFPFPLPFPFPFPVLLFPCGLFVA